MVSFVRQTLNLSRCFWDGFGRPRCDSQFYALEMEDSVMFWNNAMRPGAMVSVEYFRVFWGDFMWGSPGEIINFAHQKWKILEWFGMILCAIGAMVNLSESKLNIAGCFGMIWGTPGAIIGFACYKWKILG